MPFLWRARDERWPNRWPHWLHLCGRLFSCTATMCVWVGGGWMMESVSTGRDAKAEQVHKAHAEGGQLTCRWPFRSNLWKQIGHEYFFPSGAPACGAFFPGGSGRPGRCGGRERTVSQ